MFRLVIGSIVLAAATAAAEDEPPQPSPPAASPVARPVEHAFVGGGLMIGVDHLLNNAITLEAGVRLGDTPVYLHATGATGFSMDADDAGGFQRAMGGVELRWCRGSETCRLFGVDAGYEHQTWGQGQEMETYDGFVTGGRFGWDAGGDHVRFRAVFELTAYDEHATINGLRDGGVWKIGGGVSCALGYRL